MCVVEWKAQDQCLYPILIYIKAPSFYSDSPKKLHNECKPNLHMFLSAFALPERYKGALMLLTFLSYE